MAEIKTFKSPELSYSVATVQHSQGYYTKKPQSNGISTHRIKVGEPTVTTFIFDPLTYNLSEFVLHYKVSFVGDPIAGWIREYSDIFPAQTVELKGRHSGNVLARIDNAFAYCAPVCKAETTRAKFRTMYRGDLIQPCQSSSANNRFYSNEDVNYTQYDDIRYMELRGVAMASATYDLPNSERYLRFSDTFKNTLLALNKMWYTPEPLELTITWSPATEWYTEGTSEATSTSGIRVPTHDLTLTDLYVNMYHEKSGSVIDKECRELVNQGLSMFTPTVVSDERSITGNTNAILRFELKASIGKSYQRFTLIQHCRLQILQFLKSIHDIISITEMESGFPSIRPASMMITFRTHQ